MQVDRRLELTVHVADVGRRMSELADTIRSEYFSGDGLNAYANLKLLGALGTEMDQYVGELAESIRLENKIVPLPDRSPPEAPQSERRATSSGTYPAQPDEVR